MHSRSLPDSAEFRSRQPRPAAPRVNRSKKDDDAPQGGAVKATLGGGSQMIVAVSGGGSLTISRYSKNFVDSRNLSVKGFFGLCHLTIRIVDQFSQSDRRRRTEVGQHTIDASRFSRRAHSAAMKNQQQTKSSPIGGRNHVVEHVFDLDGIGFGGQTKPKR